MHGFSRPGAATAPVSLGLPREDGARTIAVVFDSRWRVLSALVLGALGCSNQVEETTADAEAGNTHALISVELRVAAADEASRSEAFAGFVRLPAHTEGRALFGAVGLGLDVPEAGKCSAPAARTPSAGLAGVQRMQLLEAGDVSLVAGDLVTRLAPRVVPTVTDSIAGVVYTTRDPAADLLRAGLPYSVRMTGGPEVPALSLEADAPPRLEGVTVGGVPLEEVETIDTTQPIDLTWSVGSTGDLVYAELLGEDGRAAVVCSFKDELGAGSIGASAFGGAGPGTLSLHRVRSQQFDAPGIERGELRFDFELAASVQYLP